MKYPKIILLSSLMGITFYAAAQNQPKKGNWRASIQREDGKSIVFNLEAAEVKGKNVFYIVNEPEKMLISNITRKQDSLFLDLPFFESEFRVRLIGTDSLSGSWVRKGIQKDIVLPFTATAKNPERFKAEHGAANSSVQGKWKVSFIRGGKARPAIGQFIQQGNKVSGSILTPSGDYRYLAGIVTGNKLKLSTFDGVHAMVLDADLNKDQLSNGHLYSGMAGYEEWTAVKDENAKLEAAQTSLKDGESGHLNFSFKDLDGKQVSINDSRFKNKVVIVQLLGSWCPNCMDETAFLSDYYKQNKNRGVEVIGLAYEYTGDLKRSKASLQKFRDRFDVQYPILITPTTVTDSLRTEKTLPQLTGIKVFPTSLILDKTGKVVEIHTDFYGPGTGEYYTRYKDEFEHTITRLLKE
ncbi:peroxiredoxin family protein [Pedobacter antarcticus]|uniref:peroxiredoxin family protein n=1 Tax=Pedobacter antarcticus TaxID=34086 RepID=UPI00088A7679|nr:TlpA disulfide reductase family protein [Pedobacter antarcticus]SDL78538.1 Peroxiredoxin [Pedobacter antarcticus]